MSFDFPTFLVLAVFVTGIVWLLDRFLLAPKRELLQAETGAEIAEPFWVGLKSFFSVFLIVLLLRSFLVEPFRIPSGSMMPTLLVGDFILVNKFSYGLRLPVLNTKVVSLDAPRKGDVAVFRFPKDPSVNYIKRIVAVPGDRVVYRNKRLTINGKPLSYEEAGLFFGTNASASMNGAALYKETIDDVRHDLMIRPGQPTVTVDYVVPEGQYFAMGDNRDNSNDSRYWGTVPEENLVGKAFMIWMSFDAGVIWNRIGSFIR